MIWQTHPEWVLLGLVGLVLVLLALVAWLVMKTRPGTRADSAQGQSFAALNLILDTIPQSVFWKNPEGRYLGCNHAFARAVGLDDPQQIVGKTDFDLPWPREEAEAYLADDRAVLESGQPILHIIEPLQQADGTRLWIDTSKAVLRDARGRVFGVLGVYENITERIQAEAALQESEERFRVLFDQAPDPLFIWRMDDTLLDVNDAACRLLGYSREELLRLPLTALQAPDMWPGKKGLIQDELMVGAFESVDLRSNGTRIPVEVVTVPIRLGGMEYGLSAVRDITERKQAEQEQERLHAQLLQAQKMESVGILAGGVAHDFNNLLHAMRGNIELLDKSECLASGSSDRLEAISRSIDRAALLVQQLLLFSRKTEPRKERIDINQEVHAALQMLKRTVPKMIALEPRTAPALWEISGDPVQIEQILLNLVSNAVDAMPDGGRVIIETGNAELDQEFVRIHPGSTAGPHVLLSVTDTGAGMDAATLKHVFDPFFTTKEVGKGTGLGLASVYGIVKSHGGYVFCSSEPGQGAMFRIYLPAVEGKEPDPDLLPHAATRPRTDAAASHDGHAMGDHTILVVDDEPEIRELTQECLEDCGYAVLNASSGEEALKIFRQHGQTIDLVLLDLNMPGMGGLKCLQELVRLDPAVRVLIVSGYSADTRTGQTLEAGARGYIGKPYQLRELATKVGEMMGA